MRYINPHLHDITFVPIKFTILQF